jgi:hypothetical protein
MDEKLKRAYAEWDKLCKEFEQARDDQFKTYAVVSGKFAAVAQNKGGNPSNDELDKFEKANKRLDDAIQRMNEFARKNA